MSDPNFIKNFSFSEPNILVDLVDYNQGPEFHTINYP